jgi:hypothetical protein
MVLGAASVCHAVVIVNYDFTGENGQQASTAADFVETGLSASGITRGTGVSFFPLAGDDNTMDAVNWTTSTSIEVNDYFAFEITPDANFEMTLSQISFRERRTSSGPLMFEIRSDIDNFASAITGTVTSIPDAASTTERDQSFALGPAFENLTAAVEFRIYGYSSEVDSIAAHWALMNHSTTGGLTVDGTVVAVPEASAYLFGGLVAVVMGIGCLGRSIWTRQQLVPVAA